MDSDHSDDEDATVRGAVLATYKSTYDQAMTQPGSVRLPSSILFPIPFPLISSDTPFSLLTIIVRRPQSQWTQVNGAPVNLSLLTRCYSAQPPSFLLPILYNLIKQLPNAQPVLLPLSEDAKMDASGSDEGGAEVGGRIKFVVRDTRKQVMEGQMVLEWGRSTEGLPCATRVVMKRTKVSPAGRVCRRACRSNRS